MTHDPVDKHIRIDPAVYCDPAIEINKKTIAVVDINEHHRQEIASALLSFYVVEPHENASNALTAFSLSPPSLIIVGEHIGPTTGLRFIAALRRISVLNLIPVIFIADHHCSDLVNAVACSSNCEYLLKPYRRSQLIKTISAMVNRNVEHKWESLSTVERKVLKGTVDVFNSIADVIGHGDALPYGNVADACAPLVEAVRSNQFKGILEGVKDHDNYSYAHSMRVATLLSLFGTAAGVHGDDQLMLATGGLLHDVGKMSISHDILNKPGRLDPAEFAIMKSHVPETVRYLRTDPNIPKPVIAIAQQHHERLDGSGYPLGLRAPQLNDLARMAAIVDVFSALTDRRVYKPAMAPEQAFTIMADEMTSHLDQHFLKLFRDMLLDAVS